MDRMQVSHSCANASQRFPCSVALFATSEKAEAFAPDPEARKVTVVVSKTGRLADVDVAQVAEAVKSLANQPQLALA